MQMTAIKATADALTEVQAPHCFYVSMFRSTVPHDGNWYHLLGPFGSVQLAEPHLNETRTAARKIDVRAFFCSFDIIEANTDMPGVLNTLLLPV